MAVLPANCKVSMKKLHHRKVMQLIWFYIVFTSCGTNRRHHRYRRRSLGLLRRAHRRRKISSSRMRVKKPPSKRLSTIRKPITPKANSKSSRPELYFLRLGSGSLIFHPAQLRIIALGNFGCGSLIALQNTLAVITVLEVRNHILVLDASGKTVRQRAFQTIANFNARASVLDGDDNERTVILLLAANAPLAQNLQSVILNSSPSRVLIVSTASCAVVLLSSSAPS